MNKRFGVATWVVGLIVVGWFLSTTLLLIFPSDPIEAEWKPWIPHTNIDHKAFWITFSSINMTLDIVILCLPQPMIWKLNLSRRRKQQLSVVFLLGKCSIGSRDITCRSRLTNVYTVCFTGTDSTD